MPNTIVQSQIVTDILQAISRKDGENSFLLINFTDYIYLLCSSKVSM